MDAIMRDVMELEADEICKELTINANNLWVILYQWRCDYAWSRTGSPAHSPNLPPPIAMFRKAVGHIISCKDVSRLVSRREEAPLTAWQRLVLRLHLSVCAACTRFEKQIAFLRDAMRQYRQ